jgi:putative ABC transport system ATP-binding protein
MTGTAATMTIEENMALAFRRGKNRGLSWGITKGEKAQYRDALATLELGLEDRMNARVGLLSGGQRQALTLLMATLQKPQLLLLDEHTAALDPKTAEKVLNLTRKLIKENNLTAMMVTHNMKDALQYGNRTIMLHEGKIIIDIDREMKARMTVEDLLKMFKVASGSGLANDRMLLS